jgi:chromosome segregation ATPase
MTTDEIKEISQALLLEKIRSKQLVEALETLRNDPQSTAFSTEFASLLNQFKLLLLAFKQKQIASRKAQRENSDPQEHQALLESRQHVEQLERLVRVLRETNIESKLETEQLQQELQAQQQINDQRSRKQAELENQINLLKHQHSLEGEKHVFEDKCQILQGLEDDVAALKQSLVRSLREAKELEHHYYESVREKSDIFCKNDQLQKVIDKQRQEIERLKDAKLKLDRDLEEKNKAFGQAIHDLEQNQSEKLQNEQQIARLKNEIAKILSERDDHRSIREKSENAHQKCEKATHAKEIKIKELQDRLNRVEEERKGYREELKAYQNALEERSAQFSEAQVHLAKKVREVALLEVKIEEQQEQILEVQTTKANGETELTELKEQLQKAISENEQLLKKSTSFETEKLRYEERYSKLESQYQTANQRIKALEILQEKHLQLQSIVSNFGNVLGLPVSIPEPEEKTAHSLKFGVIEENSEDKENHKATSGPYQGLFDLPKNSKNDKKDDLFE